MTESRSYNYIHGQGHMDLARAIRQCLFKVGEVNFAS